MSSPGCRGRARNPSSIRLHAILHSGNDAAGVGIVQKEPAAGESRFFAFGDTPLITADHGEVPVLESDLGCRASGHRQAKVVLAMIGAIDG
jgi:hypothetical protein